MKLISIFWLILCVVIYGHAEHQQKIKQRDINDAAETTDYALTKIPVYLIPNTPPISENKVPVAIIPGLYSPSHLNAGFKEVKQYKYGFYAPYKIPKVTPIHEPSSEEIPLTYDTQYLQQKPEYNSIYKQQSPVGKDYQTNSVSFFKDDSEAKNVNVKYNNLLQNSNTYASLASSSYGYPTTEHQNYASSTKKFTTYDPENQVQIQYVIKYVPVPYTVPSTALSSADQQIQNAGEITYITPKPNFHKDSYKKSQSSNSQTAQTVTPITYSPSTKAYLEYAKYAEAYDKLPIEESRQQQQLSSYKSYIQQQPSLYKYNEKTSKKYVPTSYVLATIGKSAPTHYTTSIKHENLAQDNAYITKLVSVPLPVEKYTAQTNYRSETMDDTKSYSEPNYFYSPTNNKYIPNTLPSTDHLLTYRSNLPYQHLSSLYKKDVNSISSTPSYDNNFKEKLH